MKTSIIIRTLNEARHLPELLSGIEGQQCPGLEREVIVVDSGSIDGTIEIAKAHGCRIERISKENFSFGRSLNIGCAAATGDIITIISGHCIPADNHWLANLTAPLVEGRVMWTYGRQLGNGTSRFSECRIFEKYFPPQSRIPQEGFFCNNANASLLRRVWEQAPFDEELTGLEDMHLAKRLVSEGLKIGYVAEAAVYHLHDETWPRIKRRFERESIALQHIMPEIHLSSADLLRYVASSILLDMGAALQKKELVRRLGEIVMYRCAQYWGSYRGNNFHRKLSRERKEKYFYPK